MTYEKMIRNYEKCFNGRDTHSVRDIGVWDEAKWLGNFVTINRTVEDFKTWVKEKGYEKKDFHFVGDYS